MFRKNNKIDVQLLLIILLLIITLAAFYSGILPYPVGWLILLLLLVLRIRELGN